MTHISICICTFKRPGLLTTLLGRLEQQPIDERFTFSVVIADNDAAQSAQAAVAALSPTSRMAITYCVEPRANIALARNKALEHAKGDLIVFIDDDEFPCENWLTCLFSEYVRSGADAVLGPVKPHFEVPPPAWVIKGRFFERPSYPTGRTITWQEARSGNVLFRRDVLNDFDVPFRAQFDTAGEDVDFFRRLSERGRRFVWCNEAAVYEVVPPSRCTRAYLLRRAALRGSNFPKHPTDRLTNAAKSLVAVPCYIVALPVLAACGHHMFVRYLIKLLDHSSRLLAFLGWSLVTERQT